MARIYKYSGTDPYAGSVIGANAAVPERAPEVPQRESRPLTEREKKIIKKRRRYLTPRKDPLVGEAPTINLLGFIFLTLVSAVLVYSAVSFLHLKYEYTTAERELSKSESELSVLATENDNREKIVYSNIELEEIRKTAMEKFGMAYPDSSQIIKYNRTDAGYVRQYSEVTADNSDDVFNILMRGLAAK